MLSLNLPDPNRHFTWVKSLKTSASKLFSFSAPQGSCNYRMVLPLLATSLIHIPDWRWACGGFLHWSVHAWSRQTRFLLFYRLWVKTLVTYVGFPPGRNGRTTDAKRLRPKSTFKDAYQAVEISFEFDWMTWRLRNVARGKHCSGFECKIKQSFRNKSILFILFQYLQHPKWFLLCLICLKKNKIG